MGASLCRLCESSIFGVRAGFGVDASHVFPQSVLPLSPLIRSMIGVVVSRACTGFWAGILFAPWLTLPCWGRVCYPIVEVETLRVEFDQTPLPLSECAAPTLLLDF